MQSLPLHPLVVHLPIALAATMPLLAGGLLVAAWRGWLPPRAWAIAVVGQLLLVASGFAAMQTGEADEERGEALASEALVESHEEAAELFTWSACGVLALMALPLVLPASLPRGRKASALAAALGTVAILGMGYRVGHAGGSIVHGAKAGHRSGDAPHSVSLRGDDTEDDDD